MSDVEIVFPQGREAVVRRLRDAIAEVGYDVESREVGEHDGASAASGASAVLILWDRSTMAHPGLEAAAAAARNRDRAIDVSVDGITPLAMTDDRALIHLSGWRGDPHHPGWRKILARLEQLCHARPAPAVTRAAAPIAKPAAAPGGPAPPRASRAIWAAAAGILILIAVSAGLLLLPGRSPRPAASAPQSEAAIPPSAAAPQAAPATPAESDQGTQPSPAASAAPAPGPPVPGPVASVPPATAQVPSGQPVAGAPVHHKAHGAKKAPAVGRPAIRYTRYSRTMRLFCERAGRSTPQCRIFNRAMAR